MEIYQLQLDNNGLKQAEVVEQKKKFGKNQFAGDSKVGFSRIILDLVKEPMFIMLSISCLLYFLLGETKEGLLMLAAMIFVSTISVYQEVKSSNALVALNQYTQPKIIVIRDGKDQTILSEDLVPGDIFSLEEGNRVPADGILIKSNDLSTNESIITGESLPVDKNPSPGQNQLFQGTTINSGKGYAKVSAIGNQTILGKLGKSISAIETSKTLLQEQIGHFVKIMAGFGFIVFALIFLVNYIHLGNIIQSLLFALTIAMAVIPEEIPVAFSAFMALGAFHMTKLGIISRRPITIENLGAVSMICLDKTGTITENKMKIDSIYDFESDQLEEIKENIPVRSKRVLYYARLASEREPFDAMEKAIVTVYELAVDISGDPTEIKHEYPLGGRPPMMTHVYESAGKRIIAGKGAPERVLMICRLSPADILKIQAVVAGLSANGLRVLGVCSAGFNGTRFPEQQDDFHWHFEGLIALYDPPRKDIKKEFDLWYLAGISIKLITGDFKETAIYISKQVGLRHHEHALTGDQIMQMTPEELQKACRETTVFARMFPEAKLRIIDSLKLNGEIVAMLGDGVNDGPALKSANIGIAMGGKGTEIAREASDLILTDDRLDKVTEAIRQGRKIYSNLKKAIRYIISIHVPIIVTASLPLLLGWRFPNIFTPIHVIFLELIMGPTCSIFYEREPVETNIMHEVPRARTQSMFTRKELFGSLFQGLIIASGILSLYYYYISRNAPIEYVRTIVFTTFIISNVFLTFVNRSFKDNFFKTIRYKNALVPYTLGISLLFIASVCFIPFIQNLFQLSQIHLNDFVLCVVVSLAVTMWFEIYKSFWPKDLHSPIVSLVD